MECSVVMSYTDKIEQLGMQQFNVFLHNLLMLFRNVLMCLGIVTITVVLNISDSSSESENKNKIRETLKRRPRKYSIPNIVLLFD